MTAVKVRYPGGKSPRWGRTAQQRPPITWWKMRGYRTPKSACPIALQPNRTIIAPMGIAAKRPSVSDLFSTSSDQELSSSSSRSATPPRKQTTAATSSTRHVLPSDLTKAIQQLEEQEFDRLYSAVLDEQKRRGKKLLNSDDRRERIEAPTPS